MRRARPDTPRDHRLRKRHAPYASLCQLNPPTVAAIRDIVIGRLEVIITQADRK